MRVVTKSELNALSGAKLTQVNEVLQITVHDIAIAYLVPPAIWADIKRHAELWRSTQEQATPDA